MGFLNKLEKALGLVDEKPPEVTEYWLIRWTDDAKIHGLGGDKHKRIIVVRNGEMETHDYSNFRLDMLKKQGVLGLDLTHGLPKPVEHMQPDMLYSIETDLLTTSKGGLKRTGF
jgi:hypothetical protein